MNHLKFRRRIIRNKQQMFLMLEQFNTVYVTIYTIKGD